MESFFEIDCPSKLGKEIKNEGDIISLALFTAYLELLLLLYHLILFPQIPEPGFSFEGGMGRGTQYLRGHSPPTLL